MSRFLWWMEGRAPMVLALVPVAVVWEIVGRLELTPAIPSLGEILDAFFIVIGEEGFVASLRASGQEFAIGFGIVLVFGVTTGLLMGLVPVIEESLDFYINMFMGAPMAAFVPLMIAVFGVGQAAIISTIILFAIFVVIVNTYTGVKSTPPELVAMARSFGAPRSLVLRRIVLPASMPLLLTGIRLGFGRAVSGLILGEMLIVVVGLGGMVMERGSAFRVAQLWALVFTILVFALTGMRLLEYLQKRTTSWAVTTR